MGQNFSEMLDVIDEDRSIHQLTEKQLFINFYLIKKKNVFRHKKKYFFNNNKIITKY